MYGAGLFCFTSKRAVDLNSNVALSPADWPKRGKLEVTRSDPFAFRRIPDSIGALTGGIPGGKANRR
jgi:hypothetical protein